MSPEQHRIKAKRDALAFRIWQFAESKNWDCTANEIADALHIHPNAVTSTCRHRGWSNRLRLEARNGFGAIGIGGAIGWGELCEVTNDCRRRLADEAPE
jgi:hypothetical protein